MRKSYTCLAIVTVEQTMQKDKHIGQSETKTNHPYHLCKTLSTNVLGEDKPGRHELNEKKKD